MLALTRRRCAAGFSLIEILVVIVIVGIVASIALLSVGLVAGDRDLQVEARRFAALLEVAQDEATLQGREFGLEVMTSSYRFVEFDPLTNQWGDLVADETLRLRRLPAGLEFELFLEGQRVLIDPEPGDFEPTDSLSVSSPLESYAPHIFLFSSGDTSPFEVHILRSDDEQVVILRQRAGERVEIVSADDQV